MYSLGNASVYQVFHNKTSSISTADEIYVETEKKKKKKRNSTRHKNIR